MKTVAFLLLLTVQNFVFGGDLVKQNGQDDCVVDLSMVPLYDYKLIQSCITSHNEERLSAFLKTNTALIPESLAIQAEAEKESVQAQECFRLSRVGGCFGVCVGSAACYFAVKAYSPDLAIVPIIFTTFYGLKTVKNVVKNHFYKSSWKQSENISDLLNAHASSDTQV